MTNESQLPPVLFDSHMAQLLGTSVRTIQKRRKTRKTWPFTELPKIDRRPRWSRDQVLAVLAGQQLPTRRR